MATKTITASATTLFNVAAEQYGDATQWWRIARANRLLDPMIPGLVTLIIPDPVRSSIGDGIPFS